MQDPIEQETKFAEISYYNLGSIVNPRKLEHGSRMNRAGIPYTLL